MRNVISGTGHRGYDLKSKFDHKHPWKIDKLQQIRQFLLDNNPDTIISGGSTGFDSWLAWVALKLNIKLVLYLPFEGWDSKWSNDQRNQLKKFISQAQHVDYVCEPDFANWKFHRRNESMVRDSDSVLALWNPAKKSGGTFSTITYALNHQKCVTNLWGDEPKIVTKNDLI